MTLADPSRIDLKKRQQERVRFSKQYVLHAMCSRNMVLRDVVIQQAKQINCLLSIIQHSITGVVRRDGCKGDAHNDQNVAERC